MRNREMQIKRIQIALFKHKISIILMFDNTEY